jgi:hypothetical protein
MSGDSKKLEFDDDPSGCKDYVLYVLQGSPGCLRLQELIHAKPGLEDQTWVQDASLIVPRPAWLTGVPILVEKASRRAHRGAQAFKFVADFSDEGQWGFSGFGTAGSSCFAFEDGNSAVNEARGSRVAAADTYGGAAIGSGGGAAGAGGGAAGAGGGAAGDDSLGESSRGRRSRGQEDVNNAASAFMTARQATDMRVQQRTGFSQASHVQPRAAFV